jgi:hypothetical protein
MKQLLIVTLVQVFFISCKYKSNTPIIENIKVNATIERIDQAFFDSTKPMQQRFEECRKKYGNLFEYYLFDAGITDMAAQSGSIGAAATLFTQYHRPIYDSAQVLYKDAKWLEKDFEKSYKLLKYYEPSFTEPKMFSFLSAFNTSEQKLYDGIQYQQDTLIIYWQMFLGQGSQFYDPQTYYDYLQVRFNKNYIVRNALVEILEARHPETALDMPLIERFIEAGKRMYYLEKLMPDAAPEVKFGFKPKQLKDCNDKEKEIWAFFVSNDLLFKTEETIIREYLREQPFTKQMGTDSPGNIGVYVGYQIVKNYMNSNANITPSQLIKIDAKKIYSEAKYKP